MNTEIPEKIATLSTLCTVVLQPEGRHRPIRPGDRFNLTIDGSYFPCSIDTVDDGVLQAGSTGEITLRAILHKDFVTLPEGKDFELREGPNIFAKCRLRSVISII